MGKLSVTNELYAAAFVSVCGQDTLTEMQNDPKGFLANHAGVELGDEVAINFADNTDGTVHLALPYYSDAENVSQKMPDGALSNITGGTGVSDEYIAGLSEAGQKRIGALAYEVAISQSETAPISAEGAIQAGAMYYEIEVMIENK